MCTTTPTCTICCVCCTALSETKGRSLHACFQTLSGGLGFLQVAGSPSDGPTTNPGVTLDSDSCVSMSHQAPSTEDAPEAARAAGECMTAARRKLASVRRASAHPAMLSQPSLPPLSRAQQALVGVGLVAHGGLFAVTATVWWVQLLSRCCLFQQSPAQGFPLFPCGD